MNKFKSKVQHNNDNYNYNNGVPGAAGGSKKLDSSNPISTHSGTGEKETLNIKVVHTDPANKFFRKPRSVFEYQQVFFEYQ